MKVSRTFKITYKNKHKILKKKKGEEYWNYVLSLGLYHFSKGNKLIKKNGTVLTHTNQLWNQLRCKVLAKSPVSTLVQPQVILVFKTFWLPQLQSPSISELFLWLSSQTPVPFPFPFFSFWLHAPSFPPPSVPTGSCHKSRRSS